VVVLNSALSAMVSWCVYYWAVHAFHIEGSTCEKAHLANLVHTYASELSIDEVKDDWRPDVVGRHSPTLH